MVPATPIFPTPGLFHQPSCPVLKDIWICDPCIRWPWHTIKMLNYPSWWPLCGMLVSWVQQSGSWQHLQARWWYKCRFYPLPPNRKLVSSLPAFFLMPYPIIAITFQSWLLLVSLLLSFFFCFLVPFCFSHTFLAFYGHFQATRTQEIRAWLLLLTATAQAPFYMALCCFMGVGLLHQLECVVRITLILIFYLSQWLST